MTPPRVSAKARLLAPIRAKGRVVAYTPEFMGLGNLLHMLLCAHSGHRGGMPRWIRSTPNLELWLAVFPGLAPYVIPADALRFTDNRVMPWSQAAREEGHAHASRTAEQLNVDDVHALIRECLLPGSELADTGALDPAGPMVVNVRRGDYYSNPDVRAHYGFHLTGYLKKALDDAFSKSSPPKRLTVVSDGIDWCHSNLQWLNAYAPTLWARANPADDFFAIARAQQVVITNSTFSYWAAHVSNVLWADNKSENYGLVWAPRFFDRSVNDGRSWLLDERWSIVESLPNGWEPTQDDL